MPSKLLFASLLTLSLVACAPAQQQRSDLVEAAQVQGLIQDQPNLAVLDVRTPQEFDQGHLKNAENLDFYQNFAAKIGGLDKQKQYLVYCAVGGRSAKAAEQMRAQGLKVYDLKGGFQAWQAAGLPVSR